jgi:hypothetical protein
MKENPEAWLFRLFRIAVIAGTIDQGTSRVRKAKYFMVLFLTIENPALSGSADSQPSALPDFITS